MPNQHPAHLQPCWRPHRPCPQGQGQGQEGEKEEAARKSVVGGNSFGKIAAAVGGAAKWKALMEKTEPGRTVWIGGIPAWNHEAGLT